MADKGVEKIKVSTPNDTMMQDPTTLEVIEAYGESEVTRSAWVENQIVNGKLVSDTKIEADEVANPDSELERNDEATRAHADQGLKRGLKARQPGVNKG